MAHRAILERDLSKLAHPNRTKNPPHSVAGHGDTLLISFPQLPPITAELIIYIVQAAPDETENAPDHSTEQIIGTFAAKLVAGQLMDVKGHATPASFDKDLKLMTVDVVAPGPTGAKGGGPTVKLTIFPNNLFPDARRIHTRYSLRVRTFALRNKSKPKLKTSWEVWDASASVWVHYHLAMVVPTGTFPGPLTKQHHHTAKRDVALRWIHTWAGQWKRHQQEFREFFAANTLACPPDCFFKDLNNSGQPSLRGPHIQKSDFSNVVSKIGEAAAFAKHGIVALTVGHGDGSSAWFNLVPEDAKYERGGTEFFPSPRVVMLQNLRALDNPVTVSHNDQVKKDVLNSLGPIFAAAPIRLFFLHTCNVGNKLEFVYRLAHEIQVYTGAHRDFVTYTDDASPPVEASYEKDGDLVAKAQVAEKKLRASEERVRQLNRELELSADDPIEELRIRQELVEERNKRDALKQEADKAKARAARLTREWPLHRSSLQAPPNPAKGPPTPGGSPTPGGW